MKRNKKPDHTETPRLWKRWVNRLKEKRRLSLNKTNHAKEKDEKMAPATTGIIPLANENKEPKTKTAIEDAFDGLL